MKELSLNILDITENSVKAESTLTHITINEDKQSLVIEIKDNGKGMSKDTLASVTDPFYTTRTTRRVGLGIPLFKLAAEQTGGSLIIESKERGDGSEDHGTKVVASFFKDHLDFTPLGDIVSTVVTLIQGHPEVDFNFTHNTPEGSVNLNTRLIREVLEDVPLDSYEVICWIRENLDEQYNDLILNSNKKL